MSALKFTHAVLNSYYYRYVWLLGLSCSFYGMEQGSLANTIIAKSLVSNLLTARVTTEQVFQ